MFYNIIKTKNIPKVVFAHVYSCNNYGSILKPMAGNMEIAYIKSGNLEVEIGGRRFIVNEGSFLIFPHKYDITIKSEKNSAHIHYTISAMVDCDAFLSDEMCKNPSGDEMCIPMIVESCCETEYIFTLLCDAIKEYQKGNYICVLKSGALFLQILCEFANLSQKMPSSEKDKLIDMRIKKYIEKNLNRKITLSDIFENIGKNANYLNGVFKKINNISIISYANQMKIHKAAFLISNERLPIKGVASQIGIYDINYFYRLFNKKMGMSVSEFKASLIDNTYFLCELEEVSK